MLYKFKDFLVEIDEIKFKKKSNLKGWIWHSEGAKFFNGIQFQEAI